MNISSKVLPLIPNQMQIWAILTHDYALIEPIPLYIWLFGVTILHEGEQASSNFVHT